MQMDICNTKEYKGARELESAMNDYSWSPQKFAESIGLCHKTIQQVFMRTIVAVIKNMGSDGYGVDLRNKASHELCIKIVSSGIPYDTSLPMV